MALQQARVAKKKTGTITWCDSKAQISGAIRPAALTLTKSGKPIGPFQMRLTHRRSDAIHRSRQMKSQRRRAIANGKRLGSDVSRKAEGIDGMPERVVSVGSAPG